MSNAYFKFKQFTIWQGNCAMKVSTDACIQGAWTPISENVNRILDIGTGTGLLSLMLAQRAGVAKITALEYDELAAEQAKDNILKTKWHDKLNVVHLDANKFRDEQKFDLIISNPPFFNNSLLGNTKERNIARHAITLTYEQLFDVIKRNLCKGGTASVLLPVFMQDRWSYIVSQAGWHVLEVLYVHPLENKSANRIVVIISSEKKQSKILEHTLCIRNIEGRYTINYLTLMEPFYL